jgi:L-lactate dehydrogenase (cytochrome)
MGTFNVTPVTALDYRKMAEKWLPRFLFDYIDGGAGDERSMAANVADFANFRLKQRVMVDVDHVSTATRLCGQAAAMPVVLAPIGLAGMFRRRGEVQGAVAAASAGIPFTLSTVGVCPIEEVQQAADAPVWFQLYMLRDRGVVTRLLERAQACGIETLVFTVDLAVVGPRHRDARNGMLGGSRRAALAKARQLLSRPGWLYDVGVRGKPHDFGNLRSVVGGTGDLTSLMGFIDEQFDPSVTWKDIEWLRTQWPGKLLVKGVMCREDVCAAIDVGADAVVVSNHGGRQLEGVSSTISQLRKLSEAVDRRAEILVDGGVRSGTDVVKALALGANGVMIGRPWVWALAAGGAPAVTDLLAVIQGEIETAMALMGVNSVAEITSGSIE